MKTRIVSILGMAIMGCGLFAFGGGLGCDNQDFVVAAAELTVNPSDAIPFGAVTIGLQRELQVVLSNNDSFGQLTIDNVLIITESGEDGAITIVTDPSEFNGKSLSAGEEVTLTLRFAPTDAGSVLARLSTTYDDGANPQDKVVAVTGFGALPDVFLNPPVLDFGRVQAGTTETLEATLSNRGLAGFELESLSIDELMGGEGRFSVSPAFGVTLPTTLAPDGEVDFEIEYTADDDEAREATLIVTLTNIGSLDNTIAIANDCTRSADPDFDDDMDGYFTAPCGVDCDDDDPLTNPGAPEIADGDDNNCDGIIDEGTTRYDDDGDCLCEALPCAGSSNPACTLPLLDGDCDDSAPGTYPGNTENTSNRIDDNCNGLIDEDPNFQDSDGDGFALAGGDCNDNNANIYPGAVERSDGLDNDCDTIIDEGTDRYDDDGDCACESTSAACLGSANPMCFVLVGGDCQDANATIGPAASEEVCGSGDGIDTDCDGVVDCGGADGDGDGVTAWAGDCDDTNPARYPGNQELPDGIDNDCDLTVDEGTLAYDDDGDLYCEGFDLDGNGTDECSDGSFPGDCYDEDPTISPIASEGAIGDGIDTDCNGLTDDGTDAWDGDGDGFTPMGGDCDDTDPAYNPGAWDSPLDPEDYDCDGQID